MKKKFSRRLSSFRIIVAGFLCVILLGTCLLMLPVSTSGRGGASFSDSLFTATSAVCVTGLVVRDTASYWSGFGRAVILCLIQIGGIGVITVAMSIFTASGKKIGLMQLNTMQESIAAPKMGGLVKLTAFIVRLSLAVELAGALALAPVFCREFGFLKGIWYSLFHSVSAFCNAGFDLMGVKEPFSSLTSYSGNVAVNAVIMLLIIVGGAGFLTWDDLKNNRLRFKRYRLQSKIIIITSLCLLFVPAVIFFFTEFSSLPAGKRILASLFQSATARTAGFNTAELSRMSGGGQAIMMILMLIGGSPGSTAGGMKTTTAAVLLLAMLSVFRKRDDVQCLGRRIPDGTVRHAVAILILYFTLFFSFGMVISRIEGIPLLTALFETSSAIGTVGLTLGVTGTLGTVSRLMLIFLMFFGRVGGLTLIYATLGQKRENSTLPLENVTVG